MMVMGRVSIRGLALASCLLLLPTALAAQEFRRGDLDGDGVVGTIHDLTLSLFNLAPAPGAPAPLPTCSATMDFDDNGVINVLDSIALSEFMVGGPPPPLPGPDTCGVDPTNPGFIECLSYSCTPTPLAQVESVTFKVGSAYGSIGDLVTVPLSYAATTAPSQHLFGFTVSVCHDPSIAAIVSIDEIGNFLGGDEAAELTSTVMEPGRLTIWSYASFFGNTALEYEPTLAEITYELIGSGNSSLEICDGAQRTEVTLGQGQMYGSPLAVAGALGVDVANDFRRGDANQDGVVDIGDPVTALAGLFSGGEVTCVDASDANDDGLFDIADPIAILGFLFSGSPAPAGPGPVTCGPDPTADALLCNQNSCP